MTALQPTDRFNLAIPAMNKCTLMLAAGMTATLTWFYNSASVSPFIRQFSILMPFLFFFSPQNHRCLWDFFALVFNRNKSCYERGIKGQSSDKVNSPSQVYGQQAPKKKE